MSYEPDSYRAIARYFGLPPDQILFLSDVTEELTAAGAAGMHVALAVRPGNNPVDADHGFAVVADFGDVAVQ